MSSKKITKKVDYCDICGREYDGYMKTCFVCGGEMCLICHAPPREGTYFNYERLCKKCYSKPEVKKLQEKYQKLYWKYQEKEQQAFEKVKQTDGNLSK